MKTETYRSLLSIAFCVLLLFLLPAGFAFAEGNSESATVPFQIDEHGIMTLEGSGPLDAEAFAELNEDARLSVLAVSVPEGVTEIGDGVFSNFRNLQGIILPDSIERIGSKAFQNCESLSSLTLPTVLRELEAEGYLHRISSFFALPIFVSIPISLSDYIGYTCDIYHMG